MEEFITSALDAFKSANGDIDKFELFLRRTVMNQQNIIPKPIQPLIDSNFDISPELADELSSIDLESMTDEEVMNYAVRMGLVK